MTKYNELELQTVLIQEIKKKIKNLENDTSVKPVLKWTSEARKYVGFRMPAITAVDLVFEDIEINIEGFEPNIATFLIEVWYNDVTIEDGKIIKWDGKYSTCWDERDDIWQWFFREETSKQTDDFNGNTGFAPNSTPSPKNLTNERLYINGPSYGKELAKIVSNGLLDYIDKEELDGIIFKVLQKYSKANK